MNNEVKLRLEWIKMYESVGKAGVVCLRCGIARPTLRKWLSRYKEQGIEGLQGLSKKPKKIHFKVTAEDEQRIIELRDNRKLGHPSIVSEMKRYMIFIF
jgi:transposase-like protein